jgi:iron complex transport system ATP-binding protein
MKELLRVSQVHVSYRNREVLGGIDLDVREGELCALLGLNGSGKTTLLRAVCRLIRADSGGCYVRGENIWDMTEREIALIVSYIPQRSGHIGGKSVLEVAMMGLNPHLKLLASPTRAQMEQTKEILSKVGVGQFADRMYNELSQGQQQLVILARALVQNTPVMLMDEPDSALDFLNRHMMLSKVRDIVRSGRAGLVTLHDPNFAMSYCDRIFLLRDGMIVSQIDMKQSVMEEIREKLSLVYGDITLVRCGSRYMMEVESASAL